MVEAITGIKVIDLGWDEVETKQIVPIHPDAKYVIVCGETDGEIVDQIAQYLTNWFATPGMPFAMLIGDFMLVRIDKLPPHVADRLGISK